MATKTFSELHTTLNTWLGDATDITFTQSQKDEFLETAIRDEHVYQLAREVIGTTVDRQTNYTLPDNFTQVARLGIDLSDDGFPTWLDRNAYDVIGGEVWIDPDYQSLPPGHSLIAVGKQKYNDESDFDDSIQSYILHLAMVEAFQYIKTQLTTKFYKNDITMSEILSSINYHRQRANEIRATFDNRLVTEA